MRLARRKVGADCCRQIRPFFGADRHFIGAVEEDEVELLVWVLWTARVVWGIWVVEAGRSGFSIKASMSSQVMDSKRLEAMVDGAAIVPYSY